jgi:seryl-tRNA(Sec) selenium transferase
VAIFSLEVSEEGADLVAAEGAASVEAVVASAAAELREVGKQNER